MHNIFTSIKCFMFISKQHRIGPVSQVLYVKSKSAVMFLALQYEFGSSISLEKASFSNSSNTVNDLSVHPHDTFMCKSRTMNGKAVNSSHPRYKEDSTSWSNLKNTLVSFFRRSFCSC